MKKYILFLMTGILLSTSIFAQEGPGKGKKDHEKMTPEERAIKMADRVTEKLSLDKKDHDSLEAIYLHSMKEMEKKRAEMKALMDSQQKEVKALLSEEDYQEYEAMVDARKKQFHDRKGGRGRRNH